MRPQRLRVMCASEHPEVCSRVKDVIEAEKGAVMVGEAGNGFEALTLAKEVRPDVAVIDSHLPHSVELHAMRLSLIDGFDIAQTMFSEMPGVRVIVLNGSREGMVAANGWGTDGAMSLCRESGSTCIPFSVSELGDEAALPAPIVFARLETKPVSTSGQKRIGRVLDRVFFYGVYGFVGGWVMLMSVLFAPIGVFVVLAGAIGLALGMAGKLVLRAFRRKFR